MDHARRFTARKIAKRIALIQRMVHRRARPIDRFRWTKLPDAGTEPPLGADASDWPEIAWNDYWAGQNVDYLMASRFTVPKGWAEGPVALHLPMGVAGDIFTHPEALMHIDGVPYASADRHHHTIYLPPHVRDGHPHLVELHGWTGLTGWPPDPSNTDRLKMGECRLVEIDLPTRDFISLAEVALELALVLEDGRPERHAILTALDAAFLALDTRDPMGDAFWRSIPSARDALEIGSRPRRRAHRRDAPRHRPRAYGYRLSLADLADPPQERAHLFQRAPHDGPVPRLPVQPFAAAALRLHRARLSRPLRQHQGPRGRGPLGGHGRHVGGARHQPARRRGPGAAAPAGPVLVPRPLRRGRDARACGCPTRSGCRGVCPQLDRARPVCAGWSSTRRPGTSTTSSRPRRSGGRGSTARAS